MIIFSASQSDETAHPYIEQSHGLFTYFLLKKIQTSKGNVNLGELSNYIIDNVKQRSIVINNKIQTPIVYASADIGEEWKTGTIK